MDISRPVMIGAGVVGAAVLGGGFMAGKAADAGSSIDKDSVVVTGATVAGIAGITGFLAGSGLGGRAAGLGVGLAAGAAFGALMGASALAWSSVAR